MTAQPSAPLDVLRLCDHCAAQRQAELAGPSLEALAVGVVSGCCEDCGGGFCMCGGARWCERCPRKNSPTIVTRLRAYRPHVSRTPVRSPLGER